VEIAGATVAENSKIEWTDHTFNPWIGCQKVSPGCDHCYAEAMSNRYGWTEWGPHGERKRTSEANWRKPLAWAKAARGTGKRPRVFCASLADVFDNQVPKAWRLDLFELIRQTPELVWLLLTKRPENAAKMLTHSWGPGYANVWLGTTAENQEQATRRGRILRDIPARVRFLSCEPLLSEIQFEPETLQSLDWIIVGGESGHGARMMQEWWAEHIQNQCRVAGVHFFMKQMTGKGEIPADLLIRQFPTPRLAAAA
jgi:protein gp37